ncbi:hypothetical protein [Rahnella sp. GSA61A]|uniref:hypothetical protein n=1 Tax=Rahnella sp. GSA61A TaxID=2862678 RepID=UPI001CBB0615|nr:hypothetical protein [Rahnella sp. GSA61A]
MTDTTDIAALMRDMRDLADRIVECQGENSDGEEIIHLYDQSDTTFKAQNILLVLNAFEEQRQLADANAQKIRKLEFQWEHRAPTQWAYDQACTALHAQRERAEKAEASVGVLEGIIARKELDAQRAAGSEEELHKALHREKAADRKLLAAQEEIAALKAKLANPVVLPAGYSARAGHPFHEGERNVMIPNKHGDWLSRFDVEHAIHVAGFSSTVKGGE